MKCKCTLDNIALDNEIEYSDIVSFHCRLLMLKPTLRDNQINKSYPSVSEILSPNPNTARGREKLRVFYHPSNIPFVKLHVYCNGREIDYQDPQLKQLIKIGDQQHIAGFKL